jgi:hypothetical protein
MKTPCNVLRLSCLGVAILAVTVGSATAADAPTTFQFDWRVTGTVTRWSSGSERESTTHRRLEGVGTLTLVRDPSPDVRFAFDFTGPDGGGSGVIPRAAEQVVDTNFAFPNPLPPDLPPAEARSVRGRFRRSGEGRVPRGFDIIYAETFVCRGTAETCGDVKRWEIVFVGSARLDPRTPAPR